jgi:nitrate/TMAO reductase-like tetraheme cytochrome c subunit
LENAVVVLVRYDRSIAINALAELESMIDAAEIVGWEKVIEKQPKASFCFSCRRYEQTDHDDLDSLI